VRLALDRCSPLPVPHLQLQCSTVDGDSQPNPSQSGAACRPLNLRPRHSADTPASTNGGWPTVDLIPDVLRMARARRGAPTKAAAYLTVVPKSYPIFMRRSSTGGCSAVLRCQEAGKPLLTVHRGVPASKGLAQLWRASSLQATAPTERHSVRRLLPNRRPTDGILLQSCSVLGAGSQDFRQDRAAHVIEDGIGCSGLGSLGKRLANTSCSPTWADRSIFYQYMRTAQFLI